MNEDETLEAIIGSLQSVAIRKPLDIIGQAYMATC
jgi:hypothetical protein